MDRGISNIIAAIIGAAATIIVGVIGSYGFLQRENSALQQKNTSLQQENFELQEQTAELDISDSQLEISTLQDENRDLQSQISILKSEKSSLETQIAVQKGENSRLSAQINAQQDEISQLRTQIDEISRLHTSGSSVSNISMHYFKNTHGDYVGALSNAYASEVVSFTPGNPWTKIVENQKTENVLGFPSEDKDLCLGTLGTIVLSFDVEIYDGDGPDIYVYDAGGTRETAKLEVSNDCETWYTIGIVRSDGFADFSNANIPENSGFRYVRISDLGNGGTEYPGYDLAGVCGLNVKV